MSIKPTLALQSGTISIKEAAALAGCDPRTLKKSIRAGKVETIQLGERQRILRVPFLKSLGAMSATSEASDVD